VPASRASGRPADRTVGSNPFRTVMEPKAPRSNTKTALILLSIAAVFFAGVILKHVLFG